MTTPGSVRKRQTRLSFTPLPSSSPARSECPAAIKDRAAAVTIDTSPSKRRRLEQTHLPTPLPSSQREDGNKPPATPSQTQTMDPFMNTAVEGRNPYSRHRRRSFKKTQLTRTKVASSDSESESGSIDSQSLSGEIQQLEPTSDDPEVLGTKPESEEDDVLPSTRRHRTAKVSDKDLSTIDVESSDGDESNEEPLLEPSSTRKRQEQDDLDSDLEFLGSTNIDNPRSLRKNSTPQKTAKQRALEKYKSQRKQQRQNRASGTLIDSETSDKDQGTESEANGESETADFEDDHASNGSFPEEDDAGFIVEDGEDPTNIELPMQFSRHRTMAKKDLFKIVVEWLVQNKINPAFDKKDEVYTNAFERLDDFLQGMVGSKYQSSTWNATFIKTLRARPEIECNEIPLPGLHGDCGACNRSNHQASFEIVFSGVPYDKQSLEPQSDSESDVEEDPADTQIRFYLGRFCTLNAKVAHALEHWKYHLSDWVQAHLEYEGHMEPEKIVERNSWSVRRKHKYATKVVTEMHNSGAIKGLYTDFKNETRIAQLTDNNYGSGYARRAFIRN